MISYMYTLKNVYMYMYVSTIHVQWEYWRWMFNLLWFNITQSKISVMNYFIIRDKYAHRSPANQRPSDFESNTLPDAMVDLKILKFEILRKRRTCIIHFNVMGCFKHSISPWLAGIWNLSVVLGALWLTYSNMYM